MLFKMAGSDFEVLSWVLKRGFSHSKSLCQCCGQDLFVAVFMFIGFFLLTEVT